MTSAFEISASALEAQRIRMDVIAGNVANANVTRQEDGAVEPYRRRFVQFMTGDGRGGPGVHVDGVHEDQSEFQLRHQPWHPDRDEAGYVRYPNVNITTEYVDALEAARVYEANVALLNTSRDMLRETIRLFA